MTASRDSGGRPRTGLMTESALSAREGAAEGFLLRWSRRKRGADPTDDHAPASAPDTKTGSPGPDPATALQEEPPLPADLAGLDPETVDPAKLDYARLMREDVPETFRRKALRRLWETDETLSALDGLNEYDEDFTGTGVAGAAAAFFRRVAEWEAGRQDTAVRTAEADDHETGGRAVTITDEKTDEPASSRNGDATPGTPA